MSYTLLARLRRNRLQSLARSFVATLIVLGLTAGAARAQTVDPSMWSTDGYVSAIATSGNTIYLGGNFSYVGPYTGSWVGIDVGTGALEPGWPRVNGSVSCSASDGAGGWYIGGYFSSVGSVARTNLAHIRADKSLDAWNPGSNAYVQTLAVSGSTVYVGGGFTSIGGTSRNYIAALDATTGLATPWNPTATGGGGVAILAVSGSTVYVCGGFTSIGGQSRNSIAAVDATTGLATAWNPEGDEGDGGVLTLVLSGSTVYVGGNFSSIGGQSRSGIAALDATTGLATAWNPEGDGGVLTLALSGSTVYVAGNFTTIGGQSRSRIAALDATTGLATAWYPGAVDDVYTLAVSGSTVYAGGSFTTIGGQSRSNIAALDATTGRATAWNPGADGEVFALEVSGSTVYACGIFSSIGGQDRGNIAALDITTGLATAWNPGADGEVRTLAVSGSTVYACGTFTSIGGQIRSHLAALDITTGLATAWNPAPNGFLRALTVSGSTVYVGGYFTTVGGQSRSRVAALSAATGLATAWNPGADNSVLVLVVSGSTVLTGGTFSTIGGQNRSRIAALDATTGLATAWNPGAIGAVEGGWVQALAISGPTVYASGNFYTIGGQNCSNLAALNSAGGAAAWDPAANNIAIRAVAVSGSMLYVGGEFTTIGGQGSGGFAAFDMRDLPTPTLLTRFEAEQTSTGVQLRWEFGEPGRVVDAALERATNQVGPWAALALESHRTGDAMEALDATVTGGETYYYRLVANLTDGTRAVFGPISAEALAAVKVSGLTGIAPNPTSNSARIDFALVRQEKVRISVVDVTGREAAVLADGPMAPGSYSMLWDGRKGGARLAAGVYYVRWASAERSMSRRLVVMP